MSSLSAPTAWHPRSDDPLFILAMDHRASFVEVLLGKEIDKPNDQQLAHLNEAKDLVYRGLSTAKPQLPFGRPAVLVDELYGSGVIRSAKEEATILAIPVEESGQSWFTLQWGDSWLDHVRRTAPDYAKVLVRDNPLLPADKRRAQLDDLAQVSDGLGKVNVPLLYELLVPPMPSQLAAANESADRFDRELRPELVRQVIADNQASGVEPRLWKVEGFETVDAARLVADQARTNGRTADLIVLGRDASAQRLDHWLSVAAQVEAFVGFAIGRSIWEDVVTRWFTGHIDGDTAVAQISEAYLGFVRHWRP